MATWRRYMGPFAVLVAVALAMPALTVAAEEGRSPDIVVKSTPTLSRTLAEIAQIQKARAKALDEKETAIPTREGSPFNTKMPDRILNATPVPGQTDGALQSELLAPLALPAPVASFAGQDSDDNAAVMGFRLMPPDTTFDVGPNHVVQALNVVVEVYDKTGASQLGPIDARDLWAGIGGECYNGDFTDPIVVYDHIADRWVVLYLSFNNHICMAMSQTADPTGAYYAYDFDFNGIGAGWFQDYPKLGMWPDAYYYTSNGFDPGFVGVTAGAFDRAAMIAGGAVTFVGWDLSGSDPTYFYYSLLPVDLDGPIVPPAGAPGIFSGMFDDSFGVAPPYTGDGYQLFEAAIDFVTPANSTFTFLDFVDAPSFDSDLCAYSRDCIAQLGTTQKVDALSNRQMYRLHYRNMGGHETLYGSHSVDATGGDVAGVRWFELRRAIGGGAPQADWTTYQAGTFAPDDGVSRWMGDVAMDGDGNMIVGYSASSSAIYPSVRMAGRLVGDPLGTMAQGELELVAGTGYQSGGNRWGDYSTSAVDPADDCTLWTTQQYVETAGSFQWSTWIGAIKFPTCGGPSGTIEGTVTSSGTGLPIEGAVVAFTGGYQTVTNASGLYTMQLPIGTYDITVTKFGFAPGEALAVEVLEGVITTQDFALDPVGAAEFDGYVTDAGHGWPLYAKIDISLGAAPVASVYTNPFNGYYSVELPQGAMYDFAVEVQYPGYGVENASAMLPPEGLAVNFTLTPDEVLCTAPGYMMTPAVGGLTENFNAGIPGAWTVVNNGGACTWTDTNPGGRSNLTGGTGNFAVADSDACGSGTTMNTDLISPMIDFTGTANATISFKYDYNNLSSSEQAAAAYSLDGGQSWTNLFSWNTDHRGPATFSTSVPVANSATAMFRFRYVAPGWDWWWEIDDFSVGTQVSPPGCVPITGALVAGFVTDANTGMAINGADVASSTGPETQTMPTPGDVALADGWWWMFEELPGLGPSTRTFTAGADGYASQEVDINLAPDTINQVDFALEAGWLEVDPLMLDSRLYGGETDNQDLYVINHGSLDANVKMMTLPVVLTWDKSSPVKDTANLPGNHDPLSMERAPFIGAPIAEPSGDAPALAGVPAFGVDAYPGENLVSWADVMAPGAWNVVGSVAGTTYFGGDFLLGDFSTLYVIDYDTNTFGSLDTATAAYTAIGPAAPSAGNWSGITAALDGTIYAASAVCGTASYLHTIDPGTGAVTPVGEITNGACIIDIAINGMGEMYGVDIVTDSLVQIDPATGAGTVIGSLGVAANYAQGMDFDEVSGTLYWAAYTASGELRTIDTTTGASTLVGAFPGGAEVDSFAIATSLGVSLPWLVLTPDEGVVPGGEGMLVSDAEFIADGAPHYGLHKAVISTVHDTPYPVDDVDVYFTKAFWDIPAGHWADAYIHALAGIRVTFGCGFGYFCPDDEILRKHMAVFMVRMMYGADYKPPTAVGIFVDVPIEDYNTIADYIEQIYNDGISAGCMVMGDDMYFCPDRVMNRAEMAVLICKARGWDPLDPPYADPFTDVPEDHWAAGYIYRLREEGVTAGCGGGLFCDENPITRAELAVFLVKAWNVEYFVH